MDERFCRRAAALPPPTGDPLSDRETHCARKIPWILLLPILLLPSVPAGAEELTVDPGIDLPIIVAATTLSSLIELTRAEPLLPGILDLDSSRVNPLDREVAGVYRPVYSDLSCLTEFATVLLPFTAYYLLLPDRSTLLDDLILLGEIVSVNYLVMRVIKSAVERPRPLAYSDELSEEDLREPDNFASFYSGHTAFAFSFAVGIGLLARTRGLPDPARTVISGSALTLAATTGVLRIASGKHFPTDVLAGAVVSSALTCLIVELHRGASHPRQESLLQFDGSTLFLRVPL